MTSSFLLSSQLFRYNFYGERIRHGEDHRLFRCVEPYSDALNPSSFPYYWAVCHAGGWIHRGHGYVWLRATSGIIWVPALGQVRAQNGLRSIHPYDAKGPAPDQPQGRSPGGDHKNGFRSSADATRSIPARQVLDGLPREFKQGVYPALAHAEASVDDRAGDEGCALRDQMESMPGRRASRLASTISRRAS